MSTKADRADGEFSASEPLTAGCAGAALSLSNAHAETGSLSPGTYVVSLVGATDIVWASLTTPVVVPTNASTALAATFALRDGERIQITTAGALSVICASGTAKLGLTMLE